MTTDKTIGEKPTKKLAPKKRTMRPGGGKSKGSGFEGQIAKKLSLVLAPLNFMRSPGSGARVGGKNFEKFGQMFGEEALAIFVADVVPINEKKEGVVFLHSIECKSYKTPDGFTSLVSGTANVFKWFEESVVDAEKTNKNPLLIFKWNNTPVFVAALSHTESVIKPSLTLSNGNRTLNIFYLDDLLQDKAFWVKSV